MPIQRFRVQNHWMAPRSTQPFILLRSIKRVPGIFGNLVVKSKLLFRSGYSLETIEPHPWKRVFFFFNIIQLHNTTIPLYWGKFFIGWREPKEEWFWWFEPFSKLKAAFCECWTLIKIKIKMSMKLKQTWSKSID